MSSTNGRASHEPALPTTFTDTGTNYRGDDPHTIPRILPHERVFPIQIGSSLFKLSGASLSSDAPSYFSQYFLCQLKRAQEAGDDPCAAIKTLYIDRDPETFRDISMHLQGYHVKPRDATHFVRLFADAQFYSLPKLISQLFEENIFITIGQRDFQIPRDLFSDPGNTPNFFSLGFGFLFSTPDDLFPGLDREGLLRPPSIMPPSVPNRSADIFADILHFLRGYPVRIRDEAHRAELLKDCRYFNFKGLEQKLIPHHISYNQLRQRSEITLRLRDILKSGISVAPDRALVAAAGDPYAGWVSYARPYVDGTPAELVLEIGGEDSRVRFNPGNTPRVEFFRDTRARIARLFEVIATKLNLSPTTQPLGLLMGSGGVGSQPPTPGNTPLSEDLVRAMIGADAHVILDGKPFTPEPDEEGSQQQQQQDDILLGPGEDASQGSPMSLGPTISQPSSSSTRKRRRLDFVGNASSSHVGNAGGSGSGASGGQEEWVVKTGQWRLKIRSSKSKKSGIECVLVAVRLEAYSCEAARNASKGFLSEG